MKKEFKVRSLAYAAILLAICIVSQFFKNFSVYITGPIINACLILCAMSAGVGYSILLCIITPITSFLITNSPIIAAIPAIMPCIMVGNAILVLCVALLRKKPNAKIGFPLSMGIGSVFKGIFMGGVISYLLIPMLLPEAMAPKMAVFQTTFSVTQLITSLMGSVLAWILWIPISKTIKEEN